MGFLETNKKAWNLRTEAHIYSEFYDNTSFKKGRNSLNKFELDLMGDIKGKNVLHLQCHFGQDSISMSRMGAKVTGVDISDRAIEVARGMAKELRQDTRFFVNDVMSFPDVHEEKYDIVFSTYGTIGWLPDMNDWAAMVKKFLKPGGKLYLVEFHPVVWMYDDDFKEITYSYFNRGANKETEVGTYADSDSKLEYAYIDWNHPICDVINGLIKAGLSIEVLNEYDYSSYPIFKNTIEFEKGKYRIAHVDDRVPLVYAIQAKA